MNIVDPYCRAILSEERLSFCDSLPDWGNGESFLRNLDVEMQEFSAKAGFSEADICSGRALLTICKDVLQSKRLWGAGKKSDLLSKHYNKVLVIIDEQLEAERPNTDIMFSVLSEMMLIIGNIAEWKKEKSHGEIPCNAIKASYVAVCQYLNSTFEFYRRKKHFDRFYGTLHRFFRPSGKKSSKVSKGVRIALAVVFALAALFFGIAAYRGKNDVTITQVRPDNKNIIDTVTNWCKYDLFGKALPEVTTDGSWRRSAPYTAAASIVCGAIAFCLSVSLISFQHLKRKCDAFIEKQQTRKNRPWYEYRYLRKALYATSKRLAELEV